MTDSRPPLRLVAPIEPIVGSGDPVAIGDAEQQPDSSSRWVWDDDGRSIGSGLRFGALLAAIAAGGLGLLVLAVALLSSRG